MLRVTAVAMFILASLAAHAADEAPVSTSDAKVIEVASTAPSEVGVNEVKASQIKVSISINGVSKVDKVIALKSDAGINTIDSLGYSESDIENEPELAYVIVHKKWDSDETGIISIAGKKKMADSRYFNFQVNFKDTPVSNDCHKDDELFEVCVTVE